MEVREAIDNIKYYINFYKDNFITENQKLAMVFNQLEYENKLNLLEYEKEKIVDLTECNFEILEQKYLGGRE